MKRIDIGRSGLVASEISLGCMRIGDLEVQEADALLGILTDLLQYALGASVPHVGDAVGAKDDAVDGPWFVVFRGHLIS